MPQIDAHTLRHLDEWLSQKIDGDFRRSVVREIMIDFISDDPEYWGSQCWWNVYDRARVDAALAGPR